MMISKGAVYLFVRLLRSKEIFVKEQAVWALGNLAAENKDKVLKQGALKLIVGLLEKTCDETMIKNASWTLSNLVKGKPYPSNKKIQLVSSSL